MGAGEKNEERDIPIELLCLPPVAKRTVFLEKSHVA